MLRVVATAAAVVLGAVVAGVAYYRTRQFTNQGSRCGTHHEGSETRHQCGICLRDLGPRERVTLPCDHTFCSRCLRILFSVKQTTCPDCRKEINPIHLERLKSTLW